ncbi:MAG: hypothetical protein IJY90_00175 [Clostridia bacterium]|nr:hypothetical protein [Clostridia bacterium]
MQSVLTTLEIALASEVIDCMGGIQKVKELQKEGFNIERRMLIANDLKEDDLLSDLIRGGDLLTQ